MIRTYQLFTKYFFLAAIVLLWGLKHVHSVTLIMFVFMHTHCTYSSRSSFILHHYMSRCHTWLEERGEGEPTALRWIDTELCTTAEYWYRIIRHGTRISTVQRSDNRVRSDTMPTVISLAFLIMELMKIRAGRYVKNVAELSQSGYNGMEKNGKKLKISASCSKLIYKSCSWVLKDQEIKKWGEIIL